MRASIGRGRSLSQDGGTRQCPNGSKKAIVCEAAIMGGKRTLMDTAIPAVYVFRKAAKSQFTENVKTRFVDLTL